MNRKMCRKCLLADIDEKDIEESIKGYISEIPADKRASEEIYSKRLEICRLCDSLVNGMCAKCGCYVELRAAKKNMYCAGEEKKWTAE